MDERFVSLAAIVRRGAVATHAPAETMHAAPVVAGVIDFAQADVVHDLVLLRLAAHEAYERAAVRAVRSLATDVLARELMLAPADIDALVKSALASFSLHEPIEIVVSPADAERVCSPLPTRVDPALAAGDLIVIVRDGAFESTFGFRLDEALARAQTA